MNSQKQILNNRYEVVSCLGVGSRGNTYKVLDRKSQETVVLKQCAIPMEWVMEEQLPKFQKVLNIEHNNLVRYIDFETDRSTVYFSKELVSGDDLASQSELSIQQCKNIAMQILSGLKHLHEVGLVHGLLKPSNVLIESREEPVVKLTEYGCFATMRSDINNWFEHDDISQGYYLSPEWTESPGKHSKETLDIYSLGCILYKILTGAPVFLGLTGVETMMLHLDDQAAPLLSAQGKKFPQELELLVQDMLKKNPDERIQSVGEVIDRLSKIEV